ncbi:uncharacterized protein LOC106866587 [Brachypodium distachyon]|uniref:uncharacterized protein LOC106866587 n=1 Tax=Brachypodium distachyon TaxID=15368 RepID=UPI00071D20B8|nr:uncharacterized protein LOC106866587 [Brachypodium distachyon]|eukprot:XP_014757384.1 uncharacterized protein LOC106866587 [Brachypodium distachyon]
MFSKKEEGKVHVLSVIDDGRGMTYTEMLRMISFSSFKVHERDILCSLRFRFRCFDSVEVLDKCHYSSEPWPFFCHSQAEGGEAEARAQEALEALAKPGTATGASSPRARLDQR